MVRMHSLGLLGLLSCAGVQTSGPAAQATTATPRQRAADAPLDQGAPQGAAVSADACGVGTEAKRDCAAPPAADCASQLARCWRPCQELIAKQERTGPRRSERCTGEGDCGDGWCCHGTSCVPNRLYCFALTPDPADFDHFPDPDDLHTVLRGPALRCALHPGALAR